ncbi:hypothetical protein [Streptomyces sp. NPDC059893]|uniref:hypothetical protein n=1 Tax=Streptomyces sp. NPDC059893 TaxID=3346990 RepID=UPI0036586446
MTSAYDTLVEEGPPLALPGRVDEGLAVRVFLSLPGLLELNFGAVVRQHVHTASAASHREF